MAAPLPPKRVAVLYTPVEETLREVHSQMKEEMDLGVAARQVRDALAARGHEARLLSFGSDPIPLGSALRSFAPDAVFNLAECPLNSAQKEPHGAALLEMLRLPYTGNGPMALAVCNDKALAKRILAFHGIPSPGFRVFAAPPRGRTGLRLPAIVKPAKEDGSAGITEESVVDTGEALRKRVAHVVGKYHQEALVEEFLGGREFNVAVLGNGTAGEPFLSCPPAELVYRNPRWRICSFESKWDTAHPAYHEIAPQVPARIPARLADRLVRLTLACARTFGLCGYARVDFRTDRRGKVHVLEVNPNPDISRDAGLHRAAGAVGLSYEELIERILALGIARGPR